MQLSRFFEIYLLPYMGLYDIILMFLLIVFAPKEV